MVNGGFPLMRCYGFELVDAAVCSTRGRQSKIYPANLTQRIFREVSAN